MPADRFDPHQPPAPSTRPPLRVEADQACGYFESSGDLARGVDVTVYPMQALPDALVRELTLVREQTLARKAGASGPLTNPWAEVEFN